MKRWIRFVNRKDWQASSSSYICIKHCEKNLLKKKIIQPVLYGAHYYLDIHQSYKVLQTVIARFSPTIFVFIKQNKIIKRNIDAIKYAQVLKRDGKTSEDICLLFDEMYLQKWEEYFQGELIGSNQNVEFDKNNCLFHDRTNERDHPMRSHHLQKFTMLSSLEMSDLNAWTPRSNRSGKIFYFTF